METDFAADMSPALYGDFDADVSPPQEVYVPKGGGRLGPHGGPVRLDPWGTDFQPDVRPPQLNSKEKEVYVDPGIAAAVEHAVAEDKVLTDPNFKAMVARAAFPAAWRKTGRAGRGDLPGTDWEYKEELSDKRRAVWHNDTLSSAIISYRGTDFGNADGGMLEDLATDLGIALNFAPWTPVYRNDEEHFDAVKAALPNASIEVVGHSLGGHRARTIGESRGVPSFGVNEGATPLASLPTLVHRAWCKLYPGDQSCQHTAVRVEKDPISLFSFLSSDTETRANDRAWGFSPVMTMLDAHTAVMERHAFPLHSQYKICDADGANCI